MRKFAAIFSLLLLLMLSYGYHFVYRLRLKEAKREMKFYLRQGRSDELTRMDLTPAAFQNLAWENDHEFRSGGEMYDVIRVEKEQGKMVVWCVPDRKETALLDAYLKLQKRESPVHSRSSELAKFLSTPFEPSTNNDSPLLIGGPIKSFPRLTFSLPTVPAVILTPPPQVC